jgi:hypothetical protein
MYDALREIADWAPQSEPEQEYFNLSTEDAETFGREWARWEASQLARVALGELPPAPKSDPESTT